MMPAGFLLPSSQLSDVTQVHQLLLDPTYLRETLSQMLPNLDLSSHSINLDKTLEDCLYNLDDDSKANLSQLLFSQVNSKLF